MMNFRWGSVRSAVTDHIRIPYDAVDLLENKDGDNGKRYVE
jgi:hypothetical protein